VGAEPLGSLGLVVGATIGETGHDLSKVNGPLLAPGLGAQGGSPEDLRRIFGASLRNVLPSYSREVLGAGPDVAALRAAADRAAAACRAVIE
jgi:orotidine-5'-phosphate decarboxylase